MLGPGAYGQLRVITHKDSGCVRALKKVDKLDLDTQGLTNLKLEVEAL